MKLNSSVILPTSMLTLTTFGMLMPSFMDVHHNTIDSGTGESMRFAEHLVTVTVLAIVGAAALMSGDYTQLVVALATIALMSAVYEYALGSDTHYA